MVSIPQVEEEIDQYIVKSVKQLVVENLEAFPKLWIEPLTQKIVHRFISLFSSVKDNINEIGNGHLSKWSC